MFRFPNDFIVANKWLFLLLLVVTVLYSQGISGEFVWDDRTYFIDNDILPGLNPWDFKEIFLIPSNYWGELLPVRDLLYVVEYRLFGLSAAGYHVVSLVMYLLTGIVLFLFLERLYKDVFNAEQQYAAAEDDAGHAALLVTAFFMLHPVHVEAVAYISGQKDLLFALFLFFSLSLFYDSSVRGRADLNKFALAVVFYYLSVLSKLTAAATALFIPLLWFFFLKKQDETVFKRAAVWTAVNIPVALWVLYSTSFIKGAMPGDMMSSFWDRLLRAVKISGAHLLLVFKPFGLSFGYPFDGSGLLDGNFFAGTVFAVLLLLTVVFAKKKLPVFGLFLFLIYLLPALQLLVSIGNAAVYDRYLYLPLLGLGIAGERLASASVKRWQWTGRPLYGLCLLLLIALSAGTSSHVQSFRSDVASTRNSYEKYPEWPTSSFNHVYALIEAGRLDEAASLTVSEKSFDSPGWVRGYFLGWIYLEKGETGKSVALLDQASRICAMGGYFPFPDIPLAMALMKQGEHARANVVLNNVMISAISQPVEMFKAKRLIREISVRSNGKNRS